MGPVVLPAEALYGPQTQRAVDNFPVSGLRFPRPFLRALGLIKRACAEVNGLPAVARAARQVADGKWDGEFPIDIFQTGSGTSTNMNANEVIARLAKAHPNDDVNRGQSSNDVIPSAAHLSVLLVLHESDGLEKLRRSLERKAREFRDVIKLGRTHLMDATPVRLGQEFGGYARQIEKSIRDVRTAGESLLELAIGGTAVGTGINAPRGFGAKVAKKLAKLTGIPVVEAKDHFEAQGGRDDLLLVSGALRRTACAMFKIASDVRLMGALGELRIPDLQPGSSIMPGKVNPVMAEVVTQVAAQVIGNDAAVAVGVLSGHLELNVMIPVIVRNVLESAQLLDSAARLFAEKCVDGLAANEARCRELAEKSLMLVTALNPVIGYDRAAEVAKEAHARGVSVKQVALERRIITEKQAEEIFDLRKMTEPKL